MTALIHGSAVLAAAGPGYEPTRWDSFAPAEVTAAAALAGLLVVAASINIRRIIELPGVVARLGGTLALFTGALVICSGVLIPGLSRPALGTAVALTGTAQAVAVIRYSGGQHTEAAHRRGTLTTATAALASAVMLTFAGISYALGAGGGLYWLAPGVLIAFAVGLVNAWVALVEILR